MSNQIWFPTPKSAPNLPSSTVYPAAESRDSWWWRLEAIKDGKRIAKEVSDKFASDIRKDNKKAR